ncbi:hypothetical protein GUJ93_ZPchr0007g6037 [Zizania palustris]|uniref:Uncharacterized protein n=1 Tax=Zizania palustris TaxID=103762 RepID=A0A8J5W4J0_ZIZPA|nr:hypothetical protein GUJ93_ZPchr0007g6037 [Zizania palustris]
MSASMIEPVYRAPVSFGLRYTTTPAPWVAVASCSHTPRLAFLVFVSVSGSPRSAKREAAEVQSASAAESYTALCWRRPRRV